MPGPADVSLERLLARVVELEAGLAARDRVIAVQSERIAELERRLAADSSNSSRPPSSDAPWDKQQRSVRPVKVQQRTSGGSWRTLQGLIDFATVQSYLDTAHKCGIDKLDALRQLFPPDRGYPQRSPQLNSYLIGGSLSFTFSVLT